MSPQASEAMLALSSAQNNQTNFVFDCQITNRFGYAAALHRDFAFQASFALQLL
jgi:hypothetical protein